MVIQQCRINSRPWSKENLIATTQLQGMAKTAKTLLSGAKAGEVCSNTRLEGFVLNFGTENYTNARTGWHWIVSKTPAMLQGLTSSYYSPKEPEGHTQSGLRKGPLPVENARWSYCMSKGAKGGRNIKCHIRRCTIITMCQNGSTLAWPQLELKLKDGPT